ncbi:MAG: hypothetical protein H5T49_01865 [Hadesarchaea archaeon]|nr:hypothetical protein [Hadesarchaea archaeon]
MGLREFSLREFLKKNFDFLTGLLSEIGLVILVMLLSYALSLLAFIVWP